MAAGATAFTVAIRHERREMGVAAQTLCGWKSCSQLALQLQGPPQICHILAIWSGLDVGCLDGGDA